MKAIARMAAAVLMLTGVSAMTMASEPNVAGLTEQKYEAAVQNLLIGLKSDNQGLRESAAFMLGELKASEAVVPLMAILRSDSHESSRVVAALALCRIGDARGVFAVRRAVTFDESASVQRKCAWFYDQYVLAGTFDFQYSTRTSEEQVAAK
jgi:HEAT repeat protein